jgi:hypothetical protein
METKRSVTLPSGRVVEILRPGPRKWRDIYGGFPVFGKDAEGSGSANIDLNIRIICACALVPKFLDEDPEQLKNGDLSIDDLSLPDFLALARQIVEFSGAKEAAEKLGPLSEIENP